MERFWHLPGLKQGGLRHAGFRNPPGTQAHRCPRRVRQGVHNLRGFPGRNSQGTAHRLWPSTGPSQRGSRFFLSDQLQRMQRLPLMDTRHPGSRGQRAGGRLGQESSRKKGGMSGPQLFEGGQSLLPHQGLHREASYPDGPVDTGACGKEWLLPTAPLAPATLSHFRCCKNALKNGSFPRYLYGFLSHRILELGVNLRINLHLFCTHHLSE